MPIFVGCEGESEQGYAGFLQDLLDEAVLRVHLHIEVLKAGDPLARIELAVRRLDQLRRTRGEFPDRFVFLDTDQLALSLDRANKVRSLADRNNIRIIWQEPCFEALLLRHFAGRSTHRPATSQAAQTAIRQEWPNYRKPVNRAELARLMNINSVLRAAREEADLMALLRRVGLIALEEQGIPDAAR